MRIRALAWDSTKGFWVEFKDGMENGAATDSFKVPTEISVDLISTVRG